MSAVIRRRNNFDLWDTFDRMMTPSWPEFTAKSVAGSVGDWHPKVDIVEKADCWELHAELPGVSKEDISLSVQNGVVTISGSRSSKTDTTDPNTKVRRVERSFGSFKRSFTLPDNAELASPKLTANLQDGVLEVTIPKRQTDPAGERKEIPITVGGGAAEVASSSSTDA